jgi:Ca-activated chloride channel family protein
VETLGENDRVSIVTYAGNSAVVLDSATGAEKQRILAAMNNMEAGGSTAGADGIMTAYALAEKNFLEGGNNRVILATDGDFNVGLSNTDALADLVGEKRGNGVYLSILGFGTGNIRDDIMETLSKEGNGNYAYINDLAGAKKVLVEELAANLFTVADDVKAQVEFNPENVKSYRLIGYENRSLSNRDFEDDTKDAGEIGAGTDVVAMFELELYGAAPESDRKYAAPESEDSAPDFSNELFEVRLRYKDPGEAESKLMTQPAFFDDISASGSTDYQFASAVAAFGHLLRGSEYTGDVTIRDVRALAEDGMGRDEAGYRAEFMRLLDQYEQING